MKKLASILILAFTFTVTVQAQKKGKQNERGPKLTMEQNANLAVKKMTLGLDLSEEQQSQIKPLINSQAAARKVAMESRKENRATNKKPSADEIYVMRSAQLDNQIAFKNKLRNILNKEQFEKFEQMKNNKKEKGRKIIMIKKKTKEGEKERG
jgi:protein CpxP